MAYFQSRLASSGVPDLPDKPHHPSCSFNFPKRVYGLKAMTSCSFKHHWFKSWPFLHYNEAQDVVFCHTCVKAFRTKRMKTSHNAVAAFVSTHMQHIQFIDNCTHVNCLVNLIQVIKGYCNWKNATRTFKKH